MKRFLKNGSDENSSKKAKVEEKLELPADLKDIDFKPAVKTPDGRDWNVKIISWNVNGIRAVTKSEKFNYFKFEEPDIICLQETKCAESDYPESAKLPGYHIFYNSAQKKGYSSTALYSKTNPLSVSYGIDIAEHDNEGRVITAEYDNFFLVNVYVPNSGQKLVRLDYRRTWNTAFLEFCQSLDKKKPVIVAGDLNVAHNEIDLANPKNNKRNSGFTAEEREDFTTWLDSGFVDSFRSFYPEKTGAYTFWTYMGGARKRNIGWRIDYFVTSERLVGDIAASEIREKAWGSDHCPIMLLLANPKTAQEKGGETHTEEKENSNGDQIEETCNPDESKTEENSKSNETEENENE